MSALPSALNYANFPISLAARQEVSVVTPATGAGDVNNGAYILINIPRCGPNSFLDPMNSYLRFKVTMPNGSYTLTSSAHSFIDKVEVYFGSNLLESISNYYLLASMLIDSQVNTSDRTHQYNMTAGCASTTDIPEAGIAIADTNSHTFSICLFSGIVGCLSEHYLPLFAMYS
jgi:hypothetical protein